jgi:hypothetical protein
MNPFVFIVGCPRSGTTLVQRVLNAHPQLAITPESHWIPRLFAKRWALTPEGLITPKLLSRVLGHRKFARLRLDPKEFLKLVADGREVSYSWLVSRIFDLYGKAQGKHLVGDKTPDYVRHINTLHALWPYARFIHVIRDGRDVALSMMDWPKVHPKPGDFATWNDDPVSTAVLWWELNVRSGRAAGRLLESQLYYEIRYESLVAQPQEECAVLCAFLGLRFDDTMLRFNAVPAGSDPGLEARRAGLPITLGLRDWRSQMAPEHVERVEAAVGELLDELGYPRIVSRPRLRMLEHASRIRNVLMESPDWTPMGASAKTLPSGGRREKAC